MPKKKKEKLKRSDSTAYEKDSGTEEEECEHKSKYSCLFSDAAYDVIENNAVLSLRSSKCPRNMSLTQPNSVNQGGSQDNTNTVVLGDMMPDDLMNTFCQRLCTSLNGRIEGMLAIQSIIIEPEQCVQAISGRRQVLQVLLDDDLAHYILVEWRNDRRQVHIFDSLIHGSSLNVVEGRLTLRLRQQIATLFGHLFPDGDGRVAVSIPLVMQRQVQLQKDGWSCGLRSIAHLLLRAFNRNINEFVIDLPKVLGFLVRILAIPEPAVELFQDADLGKSLKIARKNKPICLLMDKNSLQLTLRQLDQRADEDSDEEK